MWHYTGGITLIPRLLIYYFLLLFISNKQSFILKNGEIKQLFATSIADTIFSHGNSMMVAPLITFSPALVRKSSPASAVWVLLMIIDSLWKFLGNSSQSVEDHLVRFRIHPCHPKPPPPTNSNQVLSVALSSILFYLGPFQNSHSIALFINMILFFIQKKSKL